MSSFFTSLTSSTALKGGRGIRAAEWMAENAYIPPGTHRLLTAGGLALGLWGGREIMDVITARDYRTGTVVDRETVGEMLRPFHGVMTYNPYSDNAGDRWKSVIDKLSPMVLGGLGAYAGSRAYIHAPGFKLGHLGSQAVLQTVKGGNINLAALDAYANIKQGDAIRKVASPLFAIGSTAGTHVFGGLFPFTNSMSAQAFMTSIGRKLWLPGLPQVNRFFGNRSASGKYVYSAMRDAERWIEANITKFEHGEMHRWATDDQLRRYAQDALQVFPTHSVADENAVIANLRGVIDKAYAHRGTGKGLFNAIANVSGENGSHGLFDIGFENLLKDSGKQLDKVSLGDNGPFTFFSRLLGSSKSEKEVWEKYARHLNSTHGYALDAERYASEKVQMNRGHAAISYVGAGAGILGTLSIGGIHAARMSKRRADPAADAAEPSTDTQPTGLGAHREQSAAQKRSHGGNIVDWINGKPLDVAQWVSRAAINPPSMHRFMNAAYLSAALFGGMKFMNVLTGRNLQLIRSRELAHSLVDIKKVWAPLRPFHGVLEYTPGSALLQDRWRQSAHFIVPVAIGAAGTYTGSHMFFKDRIQKLQTPSTLEDYTDRIALEQSKPFAALTAITSIFNTGSGIHLLPVFNYSSNLHNRYLLASGQQVSMPGLGKWWSGNAGLTPWGVKKSLHYMANYLAYNEDARPKELPNLVYSVLGKLYPTLPEDGLLQKKREFMHVINEVRDGFLVDGHVPHAKQDELAKTMKQLITGKGFEQTLMQIGLDPAQADLASNGVSGKIANLLGQKGDVKHLTDEYRTKFAERATTYNAVTPQDIVAGKPASGHLVKPHASANDNGTEANDNLKPAPTRLEAERQHEGRVTTAARAMADTASRA